MHKILGVLIVSATISATAYAQTGINRREHEQRERIQQGVRSGELTKREVHKLAAQQTHIRRAEARAKADGSLTVVERRRLDRELDRAGHNIYRQKHDRQDR